MQNDFPKMVHIETNNICNLKCIHCPQSCIEKITDYKPQSMSLETFKKIVDEVCKYNSVLRWTNDGEPLIHPKANDMIDYIINKKIKTFCFNTNGVFLNEKISNTIFNSENTKIVVEVSLDALYKKTYEEIRVNSNYITVLKNIFNFIDNKKNNKKIKLFVSIINQPEALNEIKEFELFWKDVADKVIIRKYVSTKDIMDKKNQVYDTNIERWPCIIPFNRIVIGVDGKIRFCPDDWKKETIIGDINKDSIYNIWNGEKYKKIRLLHTEKKFKEIYPCDMCKEWQAINPNYDYMIALKEIFGEKNVV